MSAFPQYATTTDPTVIETIQRNSQGVKDFHARACAFALEQGVEKGAYYPSSFAGGHRVRAIGGDTRPETGRWKQGYQGHGWLPFKSNPLQSALEEIRFDEEDVLGLPGMIEGPYLSNGSHVIATPRPFIVDGAAYVGFNFIPADPGHSSASSSPDVGGWTEIKASEYHAAMETFNERVTSTAANVPS